MRMTHKYKYKMCHLYSFEVLYGVSDVSSIQILLFLPFFICSSSRYLIIVAVLCNSHNITKQFLNNVLFCIFIFIEFDNCRKLWQYIVHVFDLGTDFSQIINFLSPFRGS